MGRPEVSVVMPFAGDATAAREAIATLRSLAIGPGDELLLVDNSEGAVLGDGVGGELRIVPAAGEPSPAHARNAGAAAARNHWILFLDADCRAPEGLLDAYKLDQVEPEVGALAGEVTGIGDARTLAGRYGAARNFLGHRTHLGHTYLPRAVAANLMVRRTAFEQLGGFYEGIRAAEDTDFSWRLQQAGWRLLARPQALVEHRYRASIGELRSQWRGYAAGRAWLARRYDGFTPEPALRRVLRRARRSGRLSSAEPAAAAALEHSGRQRRAYFGLDAVLAVEELAGLLLSNRPRRAEPTDPVRAVLVVERFPVPGDPRVELALALERARVEAAARPVVVDLASARTLRISYREDDGVAARAVALAALVLRHPIRSARDIWARTSDSPSLAALAPAARRLARDPGARLSPLGGEEARAVARRLAALSARSVKD